MDQEPAQRESLRDEIKVIDFNVLRLAVGGIAFGMPFVLTSMVEPSSLEPLTSISAYYYADEARDVFVGCLCAIAMFLFAYRGNRESAIDPWMSPLAGLFALGVAFFPTLPECAANLPSCPSPEQTSEARVHYLSAAGLFIILAIFCLYSFQKFVGPILTRAQRVRSSLYYFCGGVIVLSIVGMLATLGVSETWKKAYKPIFYLEYAALVAFGVAWLIASKIVNVPFLVDRGEALVRVRPIGLDGLKRAIRRKRGGR